MRSTICYMRFALLSIILMGVFFAVSCASSPAPPVNAGDDGIALKGYDPVAYFTMSKPVKGDERFAYEWRGAKWLFSSKQHMDIFTADPEKYAPQYGGY